MKKLKIKNLKKTKEIEIALLVLMFLGILSLNLWLSWLAFWLLFFLRLKQVIKFFNKIEKLFL